MDYRISLVGLLIGFLVGLTGMGGGSLLAPIMILFFRIPPVWAVGTDLAYSTVTKAVGSIVHIRQKNLEARKQEAREGVVSSHNTWEKRYRPLVTALVGAFVGFLVGLTSVGSGTLIIVSLAFLFPRLTSKELVGTDVFQAFMLLASGAIGYLNAGTINWTIAGLLLIGSLPGVVIGSKLSKYVPERYMRPVLATVLAVSGWKLI